MPSDGAFIWSIHLRCTTISVGAPIPGSGVTGPQGLLVSLVLPGIWGKNISESLLGNISSPAPRCGIAIQVRMYKYRDCSTSRIRDCSTSRIRGCSAPRCSGIGRCTKNVCFFVNVFLTIRSHNGDLAAIPPGNYSYGRPTSFWLWSKYGKSLKKSYVC